MYARYAWKSLVMALVVLLSGQQAESALGSFGHPDPSTHTLRSEQRGINDAKDEVFLFKQGGVKTEGVVFAFSAELYTPISFAFQIYRPTNVSNEFIFLAEFPVVPSVNAQQREDYYLESFLQNRSCVHVMPGDRLALRFTSQSVPVKYGFGYRDEPQRPDLVHKALPSNSPPKLGDRRTFDTTEHPYTFLATGYIHVDNTSKTSWNSTEVSCVKGLTLPRQPVTVVSTTYVPPIGVPGNTGATGPKGLPGVNGTRGFMGPNSTERGDDGSKGATGDMGPLGLMGVNSTATGDMGMNGSDGMVGPMGNTGATGRQGPVGQGGPIGRPGESYLLDINIGRILDQTEEGWWESKDSIEGIYIWLAIATFALLVSFVLLIVDCCLHSGANQYLADSQNS